MTRRDQTTEPQGFASGSVSARLSMRKRRPRLRWVLVPLVFALVAAGGYGTVQTISGDYDGDGLTNSAEWSGWVTQDGSEHRTDPYKADTDGDGLTDGDEAGGIVTNAQGDSVYVGYSDPLVPDTDHDGLSDSEEADLSLDPVDPDSDDDELSDGREVLVVGSAPDLADTDGDGFKDGYEDANRDSRGLDPLSVDIEVSKWTYATDFAKGALAGDLLREDSLAWLAGNLTSGAASSIPLVGSAVGAVADLRDAIGSAIHGDWVGSGFSALGAVPGGDLVAIPGKVAEFIARNPQLVGAVAALIVSAKWIPDAIKFDALRKLVKHGDDVAGVGGITRVSDDVLARFATSRAGLAGLTDAVARPTHVVGAPAKFFTTWKAGEKWLEDLYGAGVSGVDRQVWRSSKGCLDGCNGKGRFFDVFVDGVAHECKVGYVPWSKSIEKQIRTDAWLVRNGEIEGAQWHFLASGSSNSIAADKKVLDLLDELGIPFSTHPPTKA